MFNKDPNADRGFRFFPRVWAIFVLVCVGLTWPLWWPASVPAPLPQVPFFGWLVDFPTAGAVARLAAVIGGASLIGAAVLRRNRWLWMVSAISMGLLFLMDQQRMQPWAYQSWLYAIVFALVPATERTGGVNWILTITASVYFYSAMGKLDHQFVHTIGPLFLKQFGGLFGFPWGNPSDAVLSRLSFLLPLLELSVAIGFVVPMTRRSALAVAALMHLGLLVLLGPWGLNQSLGVLAWNVALAAQAGWMWVAFRNHDDTKTESHSSSPDHHLKTTKPVAWLIVGLALIAPLTERWVYWDHWLSWSLYSPHTSRAEVQLHQSAISKLPAPMERWLQPDLDDDRWRTLSLQQWSLETCGAPVYPQSRTQIAVADELARQYGLTDDIRVIERGIANRFNGRRTETLLLGHREIENRRKMFWISRRSSPRAKQTSTWLLER